MILAKRKFNSKFLLFILQLVVMSFVFLLLVDKQTVFIIKDFVQSLNLDANIQSLLARMYLGFKMLFDAPSFVGIFIIIIQIICATWTFKALFLNYPKKVLMDAEDVDLPKSKIESYTAIKSYSYLENQRLLN